MSRQPTIDITGAAGRLLRAALATAGRVVPRPSQEAAAQWLVRKKYARWSRGTLCITIPRYDAENNRMPGPETGREYYERLCENPSMPSSREWVEQARSGMATKPGPLGTVTRQSGINRAVIPSPSPPRPPKSPEEIAAKNESMTAAKDRWLEKFGCTAAELLQFGLEGRLQYCEGCGDVGVFHRDRGGWKSMCRACRKSNR